MRRQPTIVKTGRGKRIGIFLTSIAIVILMIIGIKITLDNNSKGKFVPPAFDVNALSGEPNPDKNLGYSPVQAAGSFRFMLDSVMYQQEDSSLFVHFTNPEDTDIWMMLEIIDKENNTIYKSGVIKNGEYVEKLEPLIDIENEPRDITILVYGYEPETYYSMGIVQLSTVLQAY